MTVELTQPGRGLHAVVIGVGKYSSLSGGDPDVYRAEFGRLGQLTSPVPSARHVANWLLRERMDASSPLRSIQVLLSNSNTESALASSKNDSVTSVEPTAENIVNAVRRLKDLSDDYADNKILFYFCGHGLSYNLEEVLLPGDFASSKYDYFETALNVKHLLAGMKTCRAESQLFLFDTCRSSGSDFNHKPVNFGRSIVNFDGSGEVNAKQVSLWASTPGNAAHGYIDGNPSVFSQAILAAFRGAAARKERSVYHISTSRLKEAVDAYVARRSPARQISEMLSSTMDFQIAQLQSSPVVPVTVSIDGDDSPSSLSCWTHPKVSANPPSYDSTPITLPWHVDVAAGIYDFAAGFLDGTERYTNEAEIFPPYVDISL